MKIHRSDYDELMSIIGAICAIVNLYPIIFLTENPYYTWPLVVFNGAGVLFGILLIFSQFLEVK